MNSRYLAAKAFFALAVFCALVGAVLSWRNTMNSGMTGGDYTNPLFWVVIPWLVPFPAAILSAFFGLVYFGMETTLGRPSNLPLALVHLVSYVLVILGHAMLLRFWWQVLGDGHATNPPLPLWSGVLVFVMSAVCCLAFGGNILWGISRRPIAASNPR
jgi:hypothetical protein